MKFFDRSATVLLLTCGLGIGGAIVLPAAAPAPYQEEAYPAPYTDLRSLVDRVQNDLHAAAEMEHGTEKQRNRYRMAQEHLSNIDRNLVKGRFDKADFDHTIDNLKDILDHNTLQPGNRDALHADLADLRAARDRHY